ncbi:MAG: branched-chain amino acid ABC transporter permease [Candidatus Rokubacteria bacterium]|nr:branched-chain amino acid ABC transporter permease [Candidatus Rokubacteria bacterium]
MLELFAQLTVNGLIGGSLFALLAISFGIILATTRTFHFAHGIVYTAAAYAAYAFAEKLSIPLGLAVVLAVAAAGLVGVGIEVLVYQPLRRLYASQLTILIASLGVLIIIENAIAIFFGTDAKILSGFPSRLIVLGGVAFTTLHLTVVLVSWGLFGILLLYLYGTRSGRTMRAVANSPEMAEIVGIDTRRVFVTAFAIGSALAAPAAILYTLDKGATPDMGVTAVLMAAIAVIVGGVESLPGAALGGLIIGLARNWGIWLVPSEWQSAIAFGILLVVILFRPTGLFGVKLRKAEI